MDWIGCICAGLDHQHLQLSSFSYKSIPTFEFGKALIYFKPTGRIGTSSVWKGQKWLDLMITKLELHFSICST
ncbi:unnamed protein product [Prunus armeniaca]